MELKFRLILSISKVGMKEYFPIHPETPDQRLSIWRSDKLNVLLCQFKFDMWMFFRIDCNHSVGIEKSGITFVKDFQLDPISVESAI